MSTMGSGPGVMRNSVPKAWPRVCRLWSNGIRRFAATSTCGLPATGPGITAARRSAGPPSCGSSRPFCARTRTAMFWSHPSRKSAITVEDAPFLAVDMTVARPPAGASLAVFDQCGGCGRSGSAHHPIRFEKAASGGIKPYIHVRGDLWALVIARRISRSRRPRRNQGSRGARRFGVTSEGVFFAMANAEEAEAVEAGR